MAENTRRRLGELIRKLFEVLLRQPDGLKAQEALVIMANEVKLTPYEAGDYGSGGRRFEKIVRFATIGPVKAGWMQKSKGHWAVTDPGKAALAKHKTRSNPSVRLAGSTTNGRRVSPVRSPTP